MTQKSSHDKAMDDIISAHVNAGISESDSPYLRQQAAMRGIYIRAPEEKSWQQQQAERQQRLANSKPDPIADKIHGFWDKLDKYLYPVCILLGIVIGYLQFGPGSHPDNQWQLPLVGGILGAATPLILRGICILAYVAVKVLLYAIPIGFVLYLLFQFLQ